MSTNAKNQSDKISKVVSPPLRKDEYYPVAGMRDTIIQFKKGSDADEKMKYFQERVGKANLGGVQSSKKSQEPIFDEI